MLNFFEHVGFLLDGNYLSLEGVFIEFHYWILHVWADAEKLIKSEQAESAQYYEFLERMVKCLSALDRPGNRHSANPDT